MSLTYTIDNVGGTAADVSVHRLDDSTFQHKGTTIDPKTGNTVSTYVIPSGDPNHPTTITVRTQSDPRNVNGNGVRRSSITLSSWARIVDSDSSEPVLQPISMVLAMNVPMIGMEVDDLSNMVANLFGLSYMTLTSKVRDTANLNKLQFGITELY